MIRRFVRVALAAVAIVTVVAACGGKDKVGDQNVLNFDQQGQGQRLGATTTTAPTTTLIPSDATATTAVPLGQQESTTTTAPPEQQEVSVEITMTDSSPWFTPSLVQVPVGGKVRFRNNGTKPYEVRGDQNEFDSGPVAPGSVYIYTATATGDINYHDPNRPFAGGEVQIV